MSIISNTIQNNAGGSSTTATTRSRTFRAGNSTVQIQEGQTLKGVVSDVHGNEITLSMEDGSSFTGKLPDANQYSIGQKAAFQVVSIDQNTIYMKALTNAYLLNMEDTIEQALEEAGLPKTPRNLDVVRSLLLNQQSISKNSIMDSIRLCAKFPDADVNAVITMQRLHLPMSSKSVAQFAQYQNQSHQLLYKMDSLTDSINNMMNSIGNQVPRFAKEVGTKLLGIALEGNPSLEEMNLANSQISVSADGATPVAIGPDGMPIVPDGDEILPDGDKSIPVADENADDALMALQKEVSDAATDGDEAVSNSPFAKMKQIITNFSDNVTTLKNAVVDSGANTDFRTPFIHEQAGFVLSPEERQTFSEFLKDYPIPEHIKEGIADGTITAREFLTEIQKAFPSMTDEQAGALLAEKPFQALVKEQFLSGWTVSPEKMKQDGAMDEVYDKMSRQFEVLSKFSEDVLGQDIFSNVSDTASDMSDNLDFMRTLNDTFQYMQLPLKLQNQNAHGDLYVMTRKEALKKDPKNLKVLLHLDMDNLGTLDIHIARENTAVTTKFYVENKEARALLEKNVDFLADAINEQGYAFTSSFEETKKEVDIVNDFITTEAPVGDLKRYNFDLRA